MTTIDHALARALRRAAERLHRKYPAADLDADDLAQRLTLPLYKGARIFREKKGLATDAPLAFEKDPDWTKYAQTILTHMCGRLAPMLARQEARAMRLVSRDRAARPADDAEGTWRDELDVPVARAAFAQHAHDAAVREALATLRGTSRVLAERLYRAGASQRELAAEMGLSLASFQRGPWAQLKRDFAQALK